MKFARRGTRIFLVLACLAAFLLLGPSRLRSQTGDRARTASQIAVVFTGDVGGYVEPCG
ncbi:MAG: hypothetical protein HQ583_03275 [Candidatus Abyssubacteria bacterium]|nr:hypothetical protein [Candidatus Abyssubacteria bacterium]